MFLLWIIWGCQVVLWGGKVALILAAKYGVIAGTTYVKYQVE